METQIFTVRLTQRLQWFMEDAKEKDAAELGWPHKVSQGPRAACSSARGKEHKTSHLVPVKMQTGSQEYVGMVCFGTKAASLQEREGVKTAASVTEGRRVPARWVPRWVLKWGPVGLPAPGAVWAAGASLG